MKFTDRGQVTLRVEAVDAERYRFEVADTGPGIPADRQEAIFEPFQQDAAGLVQGGTGLGLAIARRHVGLMEGRLAVDSRPGEGARFSFTARLPRGVAAVRDEEAWARVRRIADGQRVRALIVDDVATNRDILQQVLDRVGVETETADSGFAALERARARRPDIVFMDMRMPGLDGGQTRQRLVAEHGAGVKVVAVSASVFEHERRAYLEQGFDGFIDKPLRPAQIYRSLAEHLGVTFAFTQAETPAAADGELGGARLPAALSARLQAALRDHSVSDLSRHLGELEGLGPAEARLAQRLREHARQYDLRAVEALLREVPVGS